MAGCLAARTANHKQRAAPLLCVGRSLRDRPSTYVITLGAVLYVFE